MEPLLGFVFQYPPDRPADEAWIETRRSLIEFFGATKTRVDVVKCDGHILIYQDGVVYVIKEADTATARD